MREYFIWLAKLVTVFFLIFIFIPLMIGVMVGASKGVITSEGGFGKKHSIAVVELTGVIEDTKDVLEELYKQAANDKVEGIVLRIDSPGGAVAPSQDIFNAVMKLKQKKPIVASMGSLAASGGFYAAVAASKVYAEPGTMTGSIGVVLQVPNFTKIMNIVGVDMVTIKSGKLKDVGNTFRPMTDEERVYLEGTAHRVHDQFIQDVAKGRNIPVEEVRQFADGRVLLGDEAKQLKLVDEYGTLFDAARAVFAIKGQPLPENETPDLYYPEEKFKEFKKYLKSASSLTKIFSQSPQLRYQLP